MLTDEWKYLHVHKHLLSGRSRLLDAELQDESGCLGIRELSLDLHTASHYVGFLYGQPMWTYAPGVRVNRDWNSLNELYFFSTEYEDFDAADACIDGLREMLQGWHRDITTPFDSLPFIHLDFGEPCGRLIVDYMVHRSCDIRTWITEYESSGGDHELKEALSKKFAEEAQRKKDEIGEPDLERCRYHLHVKKGLPCYLDK